MQKSLKNNETEQHIKRIIHHDQVGLCCNVRLVQQMKINQYDIPLKKTERNKHHVVILIDAEKKISQNSTPFCD